jgi:hypothetical protein
MVVQLYYEEIRSMQQILEPANREVKTVQACLKWMRNTPFRTLSTAFRQRQKELREELGAQFQVKIIRECAGCHKLYSAREMRSHKCKIAWPLRTVREEDVAAAKLEALRDGPKTGSAPLNDASEG